MKNLFNTIKNAVGSMGRSVEQTVADTRVALKNAAYNFEESNGVFVQELVKDKWTPYYRKLQLIPDRNRLTLKYELFASPEKGQPAFHLPSQPDIPSGYEVRLDSHVMTIESSISGSDLNADKLSSNLTDLIENMHATARKVAPLSGIPFVFRTVSSVELALEGEDGFSFRMIDKYRAMITVSKDENVPAPWFVYVMVNDSGFVFKTVVKDDIKDSMAKEGFSASYKYPLTTAEKIIGFNNVKDIIELRDKIFLIVRRARTVLKKIANSSSFNDELLNVTVYDTSYITDELKSSRYFVKVDEEGDMKFEIPSTPEFAYDLFAWIYLSPDRITVDCGISGVTLTGRLEGVAMMFEERNPGFKFKVADGKLRIKGYIDPEDFKAECANSVASSEVKKKLDKIIGFWPEIVSALNMRSKDNEFFDIKYFQTELKKCSGFVEIDKDGDVKFNFTGDEKFRPEIFAWVLLSKSRVSIEGGLSEFKKLAGNVNIKNAVAKYNSGSTNGFEAYIYNETSIRIRKRIESDSFSLDQLKSGALKEVKDSIDGLKKQLEVLSRQIGIKVSYFVPDKTTMLSLYKQFDFLTVTDCTDKVTKVDFMAMHTTDGDELSNADFRVEYGGDSIKFECNFKTCTETPESSREPVAKAVAGAMDRGASWKLYSTYTEIKHSVSKDYFDTYADFSKFVSRCIDAILDQIPTVAHIALDAVNEEIRKRNEQREREAREAEERRRREEQQRQEERRRELSESFTFTLRSSTVIRKLQEGFTEDYPYLRLGFFMVKTGQKADRQGGTISSYSSDTTLGEIRSFRGECKVSISAGSTPNDLEREFRSKAGLVIKICYNDENDNRIYISKDSSYYGMPILDIGRELRRRGCKTADIS